MKYYKWMLRMAVPAAAITVLIFTVPIGAGQLPAVLYALVTNLLITAVIYTMIATPFFCDYDCAHTEPTGTR